MFTSWGVETVKVFTESELETILTALDSGDYGAWLHFDHVPGEIDVRTGTAAVTGRLCVIGSQLKEDKLAELFGL